MIFFPLSRDLSLFSLAFTAAVIVFVLPSLIVSLFSFEINLISVWILSDCSTYSLLGIEFKEIKYYSHLNGYPRGFVDTLIGTGLTKYPNRLDNESIVPVAGCQSSIHLQVDRLDEVEVPTSNRINPSRYWRSFRCQASTSRADVLPDERPRT